MSTTGAHAEADAAAVEIAERFGETGERPRAQLRRMARLMGAAWMRETADDAETAREAGWLRVTRRGDGEPRTTGGVFFFVARDQAEIRVVAGDITRRQFFRCFFDRPKKPRPPAPPAPKREKKPKPPPAPRCTHERRAPAGKHYPQAEVYTVRRRG